MYLLKKDVEGLQLVKTYVEQHFAESIRIEDLSRMIGFSKSKLHQTYRFRYNVTIIDYQISLRMRRGAELLQSDLSVKEVAVAVGYASIKSKFGFLFKKHFGLTPMEYKKQFRIDSSPTENDNFNGRSEE